MTNDKSILKEIPPNHEAYSSLVSKPINQLVVVSFLLLIYHVGSIFTKDSLAVPKMLEMVVLWFGGTAKYLIAFFVVAVLLGQHIMHKDKFRPNGWAILAIVIEGAVLTLPVVVISWITGGKWMVNAQAEIQQVVENTSDILPVYAEILKSIGAGVYEEFLFRLVFISAGSLFLMDLIKIDKISSALILVSLSAILFSASHFQIEQIKALDFESFDRLLFLALAGAWWGILFIWRGFGVAVCSHICWDLICVYYSTRHFAN